MDFILLLKALILGVVEGLTEFLPISSTGHLILFGDLLDFNDEKSKVFTIAIQLGAILAVCWEYRKKITGIVMGIGSDASANRFVLNLFIAFMPAAVMGLLFIDVIKQYLFNPLSVATALVIGGVVILWAERRDHVIDVEQVDDMDWKHALKVGMAQCLALIPGTSRSGATIIGGLLFGLSRKAAAEFSFFLAIPIMFAATFYDVYKNRAILELSDVSMFAVGFMGAFFSALVAIRALIRFISNHDFTVFAWYRIVFGIVILVTAYTGVIGWSEM
ncbi:undecaprenyl-diphosphatase [Nitrosomonas ureae]|uniref:Undecaprenyl-diphosphatase n=1 Tax=Nitrosomonas ureae TaxID=44577 RepID=A0A286A8W9_9PROT|nr:undecaprenyl-diphosphate phosphatase [Nitrosomonas ureae]PXX13736.1 undecaprenyl-diphosphatase [Nitrosomonas ureae]SOD18311.1 Undecaprenyl-diphosphatase [Nitrosomonas ureae]